MPSKNPLPVTPLTAEQCVERAQQNAPALRRRMAAFIYEGVLLFGLFMAVGFAYSVAVQQKHGLQGREGMMAVQFLTLGLYFIWFWTHGGQTLAMKTWHLRLVSQMGAPISLRSALMRFMMSWLWFMPAWGGSWLAGWHQSKLLYGAMFVWAGMYAALTWLLPQKQFLHDVICGTRLIDNRG